METQEGSVVRGIARSAEQILQAHAKLVDMIASATVDVTLYANEDEDGKFSYYCRLTTGDFDNPTELIIIEGEKFEWVVRRAYNWWIKWQKGQGAA